MKSWVWVGIDIAKKWLDVYRLVGTKGEYRRFPNTPAGHRDLVAWCLSAGECHFCMESTGSYGFALASHLASQGLKVSVENPRFIKHWGTATRYQNKTDRADARLIATYCREVQPPVWSLTDPRLREVHLLLGRITELEKLMRQEANRLEDPSLPESVKASLKRSVKHLEDEQEAVFKLLEGRLEELPELKVKMNVLVREPGVGQLTALRVLDHFEWDVKRFQSAQQAAAAVGYNPVLRQSGKHRGKTTISKRGPAQLRGELYMAAVSAIQHNPKVKAHYEKLLAKGKHKMAALTAAARKLVMILFGILKAFQNGIQPQYSKEKERYTDLRGRQRSFPKNKKA